MDEFPATISLRPVGSVSGRLVADGGGGGGIPLQIVSFELPGFDAHGQRIDTQDARVTQYGLAEVTTDAEGRFAAPALVSVSGPQPPIIATVQ